ALDGHFTEKHRLAQIETGSFLEIAWIGGFEKHRTSKLVGFRWVQTPHFSLRKLLPQPLMPVSREIWVNYAVQGTSMIITSILGLWLGPRRPWPACTKLPVNMNST